MKQKINKKLDKDEIHIYILRISDANFSLTNNKILNKKELSRANKFAFDKDKKTYIVAHILLRTVLSQYLSVQLSKLCFKNNKYGKPEQTNFSKEEIYFNISHTQNFACCAVSHHPMIGIDVECINNYDLYSKDTGNYLNKKEVQDIDIMQASGRPVRFFTYWTLRESFVKAMGEGLSLLSKPLYFSLGGDNQSITFFSEASLTDAKNWKFIVLKTVDNFYAISVAVKSSEKSRTIFSVYNVKKSSETNDVVCLAKTDNSSLILDGKDVNINI
ncbi:MAG: 4'-phosphopantetheinyl transferase superfamily protein [bacterium]